MSTDFSELRSVAKKALEDENCAFVLGHRRSTALPARSVPHFARTAEQCEQLVFDQTCQINLSGLIKQHHRTTERFAVIAKGCDVRGLISLMQEKQLLREQVYIIGVTCPGVLDFDRITDKRAQAVEASPETVEERCLTCNVTRPHLSDCIVECASTFPYDEQRLHPAATRLEAMSLDERRVHWQETLSNCIRCHACQRVCPVCACASCIFDCTTPVWVDRSPNPSDNELFSMVRLWHMAGRCVGCGECERVCPVGIPFSEITAQLPIDAESLFDQRPGEDPQAKRLLVSFDEEHDAVVADFIL